MFGPLDGQLAAGVEVDDVRHAVERAAVLAQDVFVLLCARQLHVHEALAAPGSRGTQQTKRKGLFWAEQIPMIGGAGEFEIQRLLWDLKIRRAFTVSL